MRNKKFGRYFISARLDHNQQKLFWTFIFLVRLLVLSIPLYFVLTFGNLYVLQIIVAGQTNYILTSLGFPASQNEFTLHVSSNQPFTFFISEDSTGWKSMLFFFSLIMAVPDIGKQKIKLSKRAIALLIGIPIIWIGNLLRVLGIVLVQQGYGFGAAMLFHDYVYRVGLVALVLVLWFVWLKANLIEKKGVEKLGFGNIIRVVLNKKQKHKIN